MKNIKLLTISIAAYNAEHFLANAVNSCISVSDEIRNQIEIVIVNDGAKDNTLAVANNLRDLWPDTIKVIDKKNGGYGSTINYSLQIAEGKYYKLLDSDDLYNTKELERFVGFLCSTDSDLIITDFTECMPQKKNFVKGIERDESGDIRVSDIDCNLAMHATCYKTEILRESGLMLSEKCLYTDTEFVLYPMKYVNTISYFMCDLYQYTLGEDGQSVSKEGRIKNYKDAKQLSLRMFDFYKCNRAVDFNNLMVEKLFCSYVFALQSIVMGDMSHKKEALEFDDYVKREFKEIYYYKSSRLLSVFRLNRGMFYNLFRAILLKK